jgi:hypothetical protein
MNKHFAYVGMCVHNRKLDFAADVVPLLNREQARYADPHINENIVAVLARPEAVDPFNLRDGADDGFELLQLVGSDRPFHQDVDGFAPHRPGQLHDEEGDDDARRRIAVSEIGNVEPLANHAEADAGNRSYGRIDVGNRPPKTTVRSKLYKQPYRTCC